MIYKKMATLYRAQRLFLKDEVWHIMFKTTQLSSSIAIPEKTLLRFNLCNQCIAFLMIVFLMTLNVSGFGLLQVAHFLLHSLQLFVPDVLEMLPRPLVLDAA